MLKSTGGTDIVTFGQAGDLPSPSKSANVEVPIWNVCSVVVELNTALNFQVPLIAFEGMTQFQNQ